MPIEELQLFNIGLDKNVFAKNILDDLNQGYRLKKEEQMKLL